MNQHRSLLSRILWLHGLATLVIALLVVGGVAWLLDTTSSRLQRQTLDTYADIIESGLQSTENGDALREASLALLRGVGTSYSFALADRKGVTPIGTLPAPAAGLTITPDTERRYFSESVGPASYSGVIRPRLGSPDMWVVVVQDLTDPSVFYDDVAFQVIVIGTILIMTLLGLLMFIDVVIVRRSLAPVARASKAIAQVLPNDLAVRIDETDLPLEVLPLAKSANHAFDRLATAYGAERDFLADAAHALRTPLAVLSLRVDEVDDQALRMAIAANVTQLRRVVDGLLTLAEIDGTVPPAAGPVDLARLAEDRAADVAPLALKKGQQICVESATPEIVVTLADNAAKALDAVLENAVYHTPVGTSISVRVLPYVIIVEDDGPGIGVEESRTIFRRFQRGNVFEKGSGLGLSVAARLMIQAGGSISHETPSGGGSRFILLF